MRHLRYPTWQEPVRLALLEFDAYAFEQKARLALMAIEVRRAELCGPDHSDEHLALTDAEGVLAILRASFKS